MGDYNSNHTCGVIFTQVSIFQKWCQVKLCDFTCMKTTKQNVTEIHNANFLMQRVTQNSCQASPCNGSVCLRKPDARRLLWRLSSPAC